MFCVIFVYAKWTFSSADQFQRDFFFIIIFPATSAQTECNYLYFSAENGMSQMTPKNSLELLTRINNNNCKEKMLCRQKDDDDEVHANAHASASPLLIIDDKI